MTKQFDVLVLGGGIAGAAAALEAANAGARVGLVRAGPGATALASGGWLGELPPQLERALAGEGLRYVRCASPLPHPFGELRAADFAAETHAAARIDEFTAVIGIAGLPGFRAGALARTWPAPLHATITLPDTPRGGWSPVALAARIDSSPLDLIAALRALSLDPSPTRLILPAVLGLDPAGQARHRMAQALGLEVAECLGTPPSVPGWRLDQALLRALEKAAVELIHGRIVDRTASGTMLTSIVVQLAPGAGRSTLEERPQLAASKYVLATGRFLAGGITAPVTAANDVAHGASLREARFTESALDCDVWVDHLGQRFTQVQPVPLTDPVREEPQALLRAGVHVDADGRPIDALGRVRYENVRARGTVIAGTLHGLGHAATTRTGSAA